MWYGSDYNKIFPEEVGSVKSYIDRNSFRINNDNNVQEKDQSLESSEEQDFGLENKEEEIENEREVVNHQGEKQRRKDVRIDSNGKKIKNLKNDVENDDIEVEVDYKSKIGKINGIKETDSKKEESIKEEGSKISEK